MFKSKLSVHVNFLWMILSILLLLCATSNIQARVTNHSYFVNDNDLTGDVYGMSLGTDANDGLSSSTPKGTLTNLIKMYTNFAPGSIVYVDSGIYNGRVKITNNCRGSNGNYLTFQGAGTGGGTSYITGDGVNSGNFYLGNTAFVRISGFYVSKNPSVGIKLTTKCTNIIIDHNSVLSNLLVGIKVTNNQSCSILNNICNQNTSNGIHLIRSINGTVTSNTCSSNRGQGLYINDFSQSVKVANNTLFTNGAYGVIIKNSTSCTLVANNVTKNKSGGIYFYSGAQLYMAAMSNVIKKNSGSGINMQGASGTLLAYNTIFSNATLGIASTTSIQGLQIIGNSVFKNSGNGIQVTPISVVKGNIVRLNGSAGISTGVSNSSITSNSCSSNASYGIYLNGCRKNIISGNTVNSNLSAGISVQNAISSIVAENFIGYNRGSPAGIYFNGSSRSNSFISNIIYKNIGSGVAYAATSTPTNNFFIGNTIYSNTIHGLNVTNARTTIIGNNVYGNKSQGIAAKKNSILIRNNVSYNTNGIVLTLNNGTVCSNTVFNNGKNGIIMSKSSKNSIVGNNCYNNIGPGLYLGGNSGTNLISYNNCSSNLGANGYGITLANATSCTLINNYTVRNFASGIQSISNGNNNSYKENVSLKNTAAGFSGGSTNVLIRNNIFSSNGTAGLQLANNSRITIFSNQICGNTGNGIEYFAPSLSSLVQRNLIFYNGASGILLNSANVDNALFYRNIIAKNASYGISVLAGGSAQLINDIFYANTGYGVNVAAASTAVIKNSIFDGNGPGGITSAGSATVSYSCTNDLNSGVITRGSGNLASSPLFVSTIPGSEDFRLLSDSPCQTGGEPASVSPPMGVYVVHNALGSKVLSMPNSHVIRFKTSYSNGSIPGNGIIVITYNGPASFKLAGAAITTTSSWGGVPGSFTPIITGQTITVTRSGGNPSVPGEVEDLVVSGITNAPVAGSNYSVTVETKDGSLNRIEILDGNMFRIIPLFSPVITSIMAVSTNQIDLVWNSIANVTSYTLFRNTVNSTSGSAVVTSLSGSTTNYNDSGLKTNTSYYYWLKAASLSGSSPFSASSMATTKKVLPSVPGWVSASSLSPNSISLKWNPAIHADGYILYGNNSTDTNSASLLSTLGGGVTSVTQTGLVENKSNYFWVRATNSGGRSALAVPIFAMTLPVAPVFSSLIPLSTNSIAIRWTSLSHVSAYTLYVGPAPTTNSGLTPIVLTGDQLSCTNTGLQTNTSYYYYIKAVNAFGGVSAFSLVASATTFRSRPPAPAWIVAAPLSTSKIALQWTYMSGVTYKFYTNSINSTNSALLYGVFTNGVTSFTDMGLTENHTKYYWLKATNTSGISGFSVVANPMTLPVKPVITSTAVLSTNAISLTWTSLTPVSSYTLYVGTTSSTNSGLTAIPLSGTVLSYTNNTLQSNTLYYFHVRAVNSSGNASGFSLGSSGTTKRIKPSAPVWNSALPLSSSRIGLDWNTALRVEGYRLYKNSVNDTNTVTFLSVLPANRVAFTNIGLSQDQTNYYWLKATNSGGNSGYSAPVFTMTLPSAPSFTSAIALSTNSIALSWTSLTAVSSYTLYASLTSSTSIGLTAIPLTGDRLSYTNSPLQSNTIYYYHIKAINELGGVSAFSTITFSTTLSLPPSAPALALPTTSGWTQVHLSWVDVPRATGYRIFKSTNNATNSAVFFKAVAFGVTSVTDTGIQPLMTYYYWLKAINSGGSSSYSSDQQAIIPQIDLPGKPSGLQAITLSESSIKISWHDVAYETNYRVYRSISDATNSSLPYTAVLKDMTNCTVSGLTPSTVYYFWVKSFNQAGTKGFSLVTSATTSKKPGPDTKGLTIWNNVAGKGESILIYAISSDPALHAAETVNIKIYSLSGKMIKSLISTPLNQLEQPVKFDVSGLSPGVYIVYIKGAGLNEYKRVYVK